MQPESIWCHLDLMDQRSDQFRLELFEALRIRKSKQSHGKNPFPTFLLRNLTTANNTTGIPKKLYIHLIKKTHWEYDGHFQSRYCF
jgi:hypothetical protein